jgi:ribosome modulation factor
MLANRARSWAVRDGAADALMGLQVAEEVQDYQPMKTVPPTDVGGWGAKALNARDPQPEQETKPQQDEPLEGEILPDDEQTEVEQSTDKGGDAEPDQTFEFDEGVTAFGLSVGSSECPYDDDPQRTAWVAGWNQAYNTQEGGDE